MGLDNLCKIEESYANYQISLQKKTEWPEFRYNIYNTPRKPNESLEQLVHQKFLLDENISTIFFLLELYTFLINIAISKFKSYFMVIRINHEF